MIHHRKHLPQPLRPLKFYKSIENGGGRFFSPPAAFTEKSGKHIVDLSVFVFNKVQIAAVIINHINLHIQAVFIKQKVKYPHSSNAAVITFKLNIIFYNNDFFEGILCF